MFEVFKLCYNHPREWRQLLSFDLQGFAAAHCSPSSPTGAGQPPCPPPLPVWFFFFLEYADIQN